MWFQSEELNDQRDMLNVLLRIGPERHGYIYEQVLSSKSEMSPKADSARNRREVNREGSWVWEDHKPGISVRRSLT